MSAEDRHYAQFRDVVKDAIARTGGVGKDRIARQKAQFEELVDLENRFKLALIGGRYGRQVYEDFVRHVCDEKRNILAARPYFRERQSTFAKSISPALRDHNVRKLFRYRFNYRFVKFVLEARNWAPGSKIVKLAKRIEKIRNDLVTLNLPLAISRARIFWSRTPKAHLSQMDEVQIATEGLMSGIDKFVPPYSRMLRGVAIGRITGNLIEEYSETMLHFYPGDKRKIYRANKIRGRNIGLSAEELAERVNDGAKDEAQRTDPGEIAGLLAAASIVSVDESGEEDSENGGYHLGAAIERYRAPEETHPDVAYESRDSMGRLGEAMGELNILQRKLLRLKGVQLAI